MRTTVTFSDDVAAAVERLRRERSIGTSEAVNELVRAGLTKGPPSEPFRQRTYPLGARMDLTNIGDVLESLDGPAAV